VLDRVANHAASLRRQVSESDQRKLDEYLESVREAHKPKRNFMKLAARV
jgi:hypothetical protein